MKVEIDTKKIAAKQEPGLLKIVREFVESLPHRISIDDVTFKVTQSKGTGDARPRKIQAKSDRP